MCKCRGDPDVSHNGETKRVALAEQGVVTNEDKDEDE